MPTKSVKKRGTKAAASDKIVFKCRFCEKSKPLDEMVVITKYFPPVVLCRD
ncbi:MAG: hypothetical protein HY529_03885, partial [Chloroflexi bacterium]|nr:hypothetical protein [Chloroflexota bacterium]